MRDDPEALIECSIRGISACCCNCKYHIKDFWHCTTHPDKNTNGCKCNDQRGWICYVSDMKGADAYSNWPEHGCCELHSFKFDI